VTKSRPLAGLAVVSLLLAGGLSGCGVAGTDFHPGVAAQVGNDTISVSEVNSVSTNYCSAIKSQLQGQNQVLPLRYLRGGVVGQLALLSAARQFAAEHHVDAGYQYDQKVSELQSAVAALPEEQQQAVVEIESSSTYISDVELAVGKQILKQSGATSRKSSDATAAGQKAFASWLDDQDIAIDPQFGVEIKNAQAVPTDTSVSYALGDTATMANADTPDQSYAASLPSSHRCG
jgi:peptidyl-prolyl cis-trans isomerase SurA